MSWADQGPQIAQRSGNEEQLKEQIHDCAVLQDPKLRTNRCYIIILTVPKQEFQVRISREIFGPMPRGVNEDTTLVFNASPLRRGNARTIITTFWVTGVWPPIHRPGVLGQHQASPESCWAHLPALIFATPWNSAQSAFTSTALPCLYKSHTARSRTALRAPPRP